MVKPVHKKEHPRSMFQGISVPKKPSVLAAALRDLIICQIMNLRKTFAVVAVLLCAAMPAMAQRTIQSTLTGPTASDWAALAKLPDFNGVWEISRARGPAAARP